MTQTKNQYIACYLAIFMMNNDFLGNDKLKNI